MPLEAAKLDAHFLAQMCSPVAQIQCRSGTTSAASPHSAVSTCSFRRSSSCRAVAGHASNFVTFTQGAEQQVKDPVGQRLAGTTPVAEQERYPWPPQGAVSPHWLQ